MLDHCQLGGGLHLRRPLNSCPWDAALHCLLAFLPRLPTHPQVLDAPALADDYYLNLVDWSAQNTLAVGLGTCVYLWSACTSKVTRLVDFGEGGAVCRCGGVVSGMWARFDGGNC